MTASFLLLGLLIAYLKTGGQERGLENIKQEIIQSEEPIPPSGQVVKPPENKSPTQNQDPKKQTEKK